MNGKTVDALALLNAAGIAETRRAEEVNVAGFVTLAQLADEMTAQSQPLSRFTGEGGTRSVTGEGECG